jgi:hypothetical protein
MLVRFKKNEILHNQLETHPESKFFIYDRKVYHNNRTQQSGSFTNNLGLTSGALGLYIENIDRPPNQCIYPYLIKNSNYDSFKSISLNDYANNFSYGDILTSSYLVSSSIKYDYYPLGSARTKIATLQNTLNWNSRRGQFYSYSSSLGNKATQPVGFISVPSIFFGSGIRKGSVCLNYYISGALLAQARDSIRNGALIQTAPSGSLGSGSIAGCVLYNEGFILLTGSWNLSNEFVETYIPGSVATAPKWLYFASTGSTGVGENLPSSSFELTFEGTHVIPTMTMFCNAGRGKFNYSSNPTFIEFGSGSRYTTSSYGYVESDNMKIKNTSHVAWENPTGSFEKTTYISSIGIYDKDRNLIGIARLAKPVRKNEMESYLFKIKCDF